MYLNFNPTLLLFNIFELSVPKCSRASMKLYGSNEAINSLLTERLQSSGCELLLMLWYVAVLSWIISAAVTVTSIHTTTCNINNTTYNNKIAVGYIHSQTCNNKE